VSALETYADKKHKPVFGKANHNFTERSDQTSRIKELAPAIRGILTINSSDGQCPVVAYNGSELVMEFVSSENGEKLANSETFTPDHIVYFKRKALWVSQKAQDEVIDSVIKRLDSGAKAFMKRFGYLPKIIFIQGLGMFGVGDSKRSADTALVVYEDALKVMKYSGSFGGPKFLNPNQAKFIDDWEVESYRRKIAATSGAAGRVTGKIAVVTGAAQGFGEGIARHLASQGAYVVIADLNLEGAQELAESIKKQYGESRSLAIKTDVTNEESVAIMIA
jgi:rhamnose utilization protein RhaD (predicted bifunctional aldolase and dehydrogenase)